MLFFKQYHFDMVLLKCPWDLSLKMDNMGRKGLKQQFRGMWCPNKGCQDHRFIGEGNMVVNVTCKAKGSL